MTTLAPELIPLALLKIRDLPPGKYVLKKIWGPDWNEIIDRNHFGKGFYNAVCCGYLSNIRFYGKRSDNHIIYEIFDIEEDL